MSVVVKTQLSKITKYSVQSSSNDLKARYSITAINHSATIREIKKESGGSGSRDPPTRPGRLNKELNIFQASV